jgi:hypothetical protein
MNEIVGYDSMGNDNVPMDAQGNKTNEMGRGIDNFLRNLLGGEGVGGNPTPGMGILPQSYPMGSPKLGSAASKVNLGANGNLGNVPSGDPYTESDNGKVLANAGNTRDYDATISLQNKLNAQGAGLAVDGINGPLTKAAMKKFGGGGGKPDLTSMIRLPEDASGDPYTEADNMPTVGTIPSNDPFTENDNMVPDYATFTPRIFGDQTTDPRYSMQPAPPKTAISEPVGSNFSNMLTNTQMDAGRNGEGSMQTVETNNQAPLEWLLNQGGQGIDYVDDLLATGAISASNFGDQFISRPGSELDARTKARKAELEKYKAANSGNIGTALYKLLLQQQGGRP